MIEVVIPDDIVLFDPVRSINPIEVVPIPGKVELNVVLSTFKS